ncbi:MAG: SpoIIE family protein phosphatase [Spirochaetia bacterium]|nr:SpoIIE family protein phosphatase [Spirochaetia bacterium]
MSEELVEKLREEVTRLQGLVGAYYLLNSSLDLDTVLKNTLLTATSLMKAEIGSIALLNEARTELVFLESTDPKFDRLRQLVVPLGVGIAGSVAVSGKSVRVEDVRQDPRFYGKIDEEMGHKTSSYLCVPLKVDDHVIGTAQLMNRLDGRAFSEQDEHLMGGFAKQAALAIQNAKMHDLMLRQKAIESELAVCAEIQEKLFPDAPPTVPGFELYGHSLPCREVGGDYYTWVHRADGTTDVAIADVSGKGLAAAMMVSELHTAFHMLSPMDMPLDRMMTLLNNHLVDTLITGKFITMFVARLYPESTDFDYVVAGHPPPVVLGKNGIETELVRTGPIMGLGKLNVQMKRAALAPGQLLVSYSDGYSEASNHAGVLFGEERIPPLFHSWIGEDLAGMSLRFQEVVDVHRNGEPANDDATLVLLRKR